MGRTALRLTHTAFLVALASAAAHPFTTSTSGSAKTVSLGASGTAGAVAVGEADLRLYFGYDTLTDHSSWDAVLRSTRYYTASYAALTRAVHPRPYDDPQWRTWAAHRAVMSVRVTRVYDAPPPPSTSTTTYAELEATVTPHGAHHWTGTTAVHFAWVAFTRARPGRPWLISHMEVQ